MQPKGWLLRAVLSTWWGDVGMWVTVTYFLYMS